jgi:hypothetical protein
MEEKSFIKVKKKDSNAKNPKQGDGVSKKDELPAPAREEGQDKGETATKGPPGVSKKDEPPTPTQEGGQDKDSTIMSEKYESPAPSEGVGQEDAVVK